MLGIIIAIISGTAMSLQGVFNTRLSDKIGIWQTNVIVQGTAFLFTLILLLTIGKNGDWQEIKSVNKLYLLGGLLGVVITYTVMKTVSTLGPTCGISIILVSQLLTAAIIDALGLFNTTKIKFSLNEFFGLAIMIIGIIIFKCKR
ncbi:MAG: DMT family transporter [Sarcina sp.]